MIALTLGQMDLFPTATHEEIKQTKSILTRYRKMKSMVTELGRAGIEQLAPKQKAVYTAYHRDIETIDRAVRLILDEEVRKIIEMRYIKGERHKVTVLYFSNMHEVTVARKLQEGIKSIANTLKLWNE